MVLPKVVFRVANKGTQELMDIYDGLYGPSRKGQLNPFGKLQFSRVRQEIEKRLQIVEVTPDSRNIDLQSQMAGKFEKGKFKGQCKDQVHEFAFLDPDAVFARGGATQVQRMFGDPVTDSLHLGQFVGVSRPDREHDVKVAIADVSEDR